MMALHSLFTSWIDRPFLSQSQLADEDYANKVMQNLIFNSEPFSPITTSHTPLFMDQELQLMSNNIHILVALDLIVELAAEAEFQDQSSNCMSSTLDIDKGFNYSQVLSVSQSPSPQLSPSPLAIVKTPRKRGRKPLTSKTKYEIEAGIQSTLLDSFSPIIRTRRACHSLSSQ